MSKCGVTSTPRRNPRHVRKFVRVASGHPILTLSLPRGPPSSSSLVGTQFIAFRRRNYHTRCVGVWTASILLFHSRLALKRPVRGNSEHTVACWQWARGVGHEQRWCGAGDGVEALSHRQGPVARGAARAHPSFSCCQMRGVSRIHARACNCTRWRSAADPGAAQVHSGCPPRSWPLHMTSRPAKVAEVHFLLALRRGAASL